MADLTIRSQRVVLPNGIRPASVQIRGGVIVGVTGHDEPAVGFSSMDVGDRVLMPGLVDTHVHINDPGRADWEGFEHATRAAAAGGVTTVVDMPLNSIPATTTVRALEAKRAAADGRCYVDVGFWGGVVPGNAEHLQPMVRAGVFGFKCFLCPSGVDEFAHVSEQDLRAALKILAPLGVPLLAHAELPELLSDLSKSDGESVEASRRYATWLESRPPASEHAAIELLIRLSDEFGARVHVVHLASAEAVSLARSARDSGTKITLETCPHYLTFAADEVADGATSFKCAPPIRSAEHRAGLWRGLLDGNVDLIATDHSPAPPALKHIDDGDFVRAWGGIASLQLGLAAVWSSAHRRGIPVNTVVSWMSKAPARLAGLSRKGAIVPGNDADLVVWDPDVDFTVDPDALYHRHHVTPYAGRRLKGQVVMTMLRGRIVFDEGRVVGTPSGLTLRH